jgi:hypothetical protein
MDKDRALGAEWVTAMDRAEQELDAEQGAVSDAAVVVDAEWVDAVWVSTPTREIPSSEPNSAACKPPSKN